MPLMLKDPVPWRPLSTMDDYLEELRIEGKAKDYIRMVRVGLSYFAEYMRSVDVLALDDIERMHIVRFQVYLEELRKPDGTQYALTYRHKILAYVKGWFTWLAETDNIERNPWVRIRVPKIPKKPKPLDPEEVDALFEGHKRQAFQLDPFDYHKREVILVLLYSWGLRAHELVSIDMPQVDMRLESVRIRNKGGGYKRLPYGDTEKLVITRWLRHRAKVATYDEQALLLGRSGKRLTTQQVWEVITALGKRVNVEVNPHRFRDTLGTTMLDNDVPVEVVMKLLGHSSREQTLAYSRLNDPVVARAHERVMRERLTSLLRFDGPDKETA